MTSAVTTISNPGKGWRGLTRVELGFDRRVLRVETYKSYNGAVVTLATVVTMREDGLGYTHAFGLAGDGDFSKYLRRDEKLRATEKAIKLAHTNDLANLDSLIAEVRAYYKKEPA